MANHIKNFLRNFITAPQSWKVNLIMQWPTIMGTLADKVSLEHIDEACIVLGVTNSSWLQELHLMTPILLQTINAHLDKPRITQIRFKAASARQKKTPSKTWQRSTQPVTLSKHEHETLNALNDPELREALKNFLIRCYQEKE